MRQLRCIMGVVICAAGGSSALAAGLDDAMSACRHAGDLSQRVIGCTTIIERSHDRKSLLRAYNTRGLALCDLDRCAEAVTDFDQVVRLEPSIAGYFDNRARALRAAGRLDEAIAASDHAIRMAPGYTFLLLGKAHGLEDASRLDEALSTIGQASTLDPSDAGIWEFRGKVLGELRRYDEAYVAYARSLAIDPTSWSVFRTRADTELAQGRVDAALEDLARYPSDEEGAQEVVAKIAAIRATQREMENSRLEAEQRANEERNAQARRSMAAEADQTRKAEAAQAQEAEQAHQRAMDEEKARPQVTVNLINPVANDKANKPASALSKDEADRLNKSLGELSGQVQALQGALEEQKRLKGAADGDVGTIDETIALVDRQLAQRQNEYDRGQERFKGYLTSIRPEDRQTYATARAATQAFPRVPYYIPGTSDTGEFWIEPLVGETGALAFQFRFVDPSADYDKVREIITMTPSEIAETQGALTKVRAWSIKAHQAGIRRTYSKRAACFPQADCPEDGSTIDGKASTEIRFNVYEDGSTAGRIQRNKGHFVEGYNLSSDSALLFGAYIAYARKIADREFTQGTQTKQDLDKMFR